MASPRTTSRPGMRFRTAVTDDERTRTGHVAQGFEHALAARFLDDGDRDRDRGEDQQHHCLGEVAQDEVDRAGAQQQREHRFAQHVSHDAQERPLIGARKVVEAFGAQPLPGLLLGQAGGVRQG